MARTLAAKHRENVDADRELTALGAGNVAAGLVERISRRSEHVALGDRRCQRRRRRSSRSGSRRRCWSLFLLFLAPALDALPRVALAAILVAAAVHLVEIGEWRTLLRLDRRAFGLALAVTAGVLVLGVLPGVLRRRRACRSRTSSSTWRGRATRSCAGCRPTAASTTSPTTKAARRRRPSSCIGSMRRSCSPMRATSRTGCGRWSPRRIRRCAASCSTCRRCRTST